MRCIGSTRSLTFILGFLLISILPARGGAQTMAEVQLSLLNPNAALEAHAAAQFAISTTKELFSDIAGQKSLQNNAADAFRHALWNAKMKATIGEDLAKKFADAHEESPQNPPAEKAMDLHNNAMGRTIVVKDASGKTVTDDDLIFAVTQLALMNELSVIYGADASVVMMQVITAR